MHRSALFLAVLSILASIPTAPFTPFVCIDHAGHTNLELGTGPVVDGPDQPGNKDDGDLSPWDDPPGNQPNRCRDVRLEIQAGSLHTVQYDAHVRPALAFAHLPHIDEFAPPPEGNAPFQPSICESPPRAPSATPLRI